MEEATFSDSIDDHPLVSRVAWASGNIDGHADAVQALLDDRVDPDEVDEDGFSALDYTARNLNLMIARVLLERGAYPTPRDTDFWNPLHRAASENHKAIDRLFIDQGIDLFIGEEDGLTPMHVAAMCSRITVMEFLWEAAPDLLNCRSNDGRTPLHFAYNQIRSTKWLLAHSTDVNAVTNEGKTALMMSAKSGHDPVVELLLSYNASVRIRDKLKQTVLHYAAKGAHKRIAQHVLEKDIEVMNDQDIDGYSALHTAIYNKEPDFVKMLLEKRPDININLQDERGNTPLLLTVHRRLDDVVEHLLKCEADMDIRNRKGETALLLAIKDKAGSTRKTLLQSSDHVNVNCGGGVFPTALHMAAWDGELEVVQQLLKHGADVNAVGGLYNTALQAAAFGGFEDVVDYLLKNGADASLGGGLFANALSAAVASGAFTIVPMLLAEKDDINAQDGQGRTAIHLAAWRGSLDMFLWLKDNNGDLSIKDRQGRTALHHAAMAGSVDVMKMLMQVEMWDSLNVEDIDGWMPLHWACRSNEIKQMITLLNGEGDFFSKEAKYGWTPENIAVFHCTRDLVPLPALAIQEPAGDEVPDELKEHPRQPIQQLRNKRWKSGWSHAPYGCDGCQQSVSLPLDMIPVF